MHLLGSVRYHAYSLPSGPPLPPSLRSHERRPAVILANSWNYFICDGRERSRWGDFMSGPREHQYSEMGRYYDIGVTSVRGCCLDLMRNGRV